MVSDAVQRRLVSVAQLEAAVGDLPRRGSHWLLEAIEDVGVGTRSMGESRLRRAVRRAGLPEPAWNVTMETASAEVRMTLLQPLPASGAAVEVSVPPPTLDK